jgi:hypothetical protein
MRLRLRAAKRLIAKRPRLAIFSEVAVSLGHRTSIPDSSKLIVVFSLVVPAGGIVDSGGEERITPHTEKRDVYTLPLVVRTPIIPRVTMTLPAKTTL